MGNTPEEIFARMKSSLINPASKMEGGFTAEHLQAVANELGRLYSEEYDRLIARSHISTAYGDDLDAAAEENHCMFRREATYEQANVTVTGVPGTAIDSSMGVKSDTAVFMFAGMYVIGESGTVEATVICTIAGAGNTAAPGAINTCLSNYQGITSVTNTQASSGGYDRETDDEFRERIWEEEREITGYGNISWYRSTAREVPGVEKAKVIDLARGKGTVDVVIIAKGNTTASGVLVQRVKDHIEELKIPGADVLVESGTAKKVDVSAKVYLTALSSIEAIKEEFRERLKEYFEEIAFDGSDTCRVSYAKIMNLLISCGGVQDVEELLLNGAGETLVLDNRSFPVDGKIEFTLIPEVVVDA